MGKTKNKLSIIGTSLESSIPEIAEINDDYFYVNITLKKNYKRNS